jgi:hypothetical protein
MKLAGFVYHIKDCKKNLFSEFKNHRRRRTAAVKKTAKNSNFFKS